MQKLTRIFNLAKFNPAQTGPGHGRYFLTVILLVVFAIHYLQRINISVLLADPKFLLDMGLNGEPGKQGMLMTFFLLAYALTNFSTGSLGDRFGPRRLMLLGVLIGGAAMLLGGAAAGFGTLLLARVLLGIGHGIHYPNHGVFIRHWFPSWERGKANSIPSIGSNLGPIMAMPLFTVVTLTWGWKMSFYVMAGAAFLVALPLILLFIRDLPSECSWIGDSEKKYLQENVGQCAYGYESKEKSLTVRTKEVLATPQFIWLMVVYAAFLSIWFGLLTWLPQYLTLARGLSFKTMGYIASLPYVLGIGGLLLAGFGSDRIGRRAPFALCAFMGAALFLFGAAIIENSYLSALLITAGTGTISLFIGVFWAMVQNRLPGHLVGFATGLISGVGNLFSALTPVAIGFLIQFFHSYFAGILYLVGSGLVGALCSIMLVRGETRLLKAKTLLNRG